MGVFASPDLEIAPERVFELLASDRAPAVIDVREPYEWDAGHIEQARHIELERLASRADEIERERPVVFQCRLGARSAMAAQAFRAAGYEAYSTQGGLTLWHERGLPLVPAGGYVAEH